MKQTSRSFTRALLVTGLLAGTLDITAAIVNFLLNGGHNPTRIFVYIASGVFGEAAFQDKALVLMSVLGLVFHYIIAFGWTILFFLIYEKFKDLIRNTLLIAVVYGLFVWIIMNLLIVPMSKVQPLSFSWSTVLIGMVILILAIGLPLSLMADTYYRKQAVNNVRK